MHRLLTQLRDLDDMREDLSPEEYTSSKADTLQQMEDFQKTLEKLVAGDVTLVSQFGAMQLAVREAILGGSDRGGIQRLFANKSTSGLRSKLASLEQDLKLNRIQADAFASLATDIIVSLERLGEALSQGEQELLEKGKRNMQGYEEAFDDAVGGHIVDAARKDL